jgi:hypothetical protein
MFENRSVGRSEGDAVASALFRAGRVASRSFKYHRPRGLYCCGQGWLGLTPKSNNLKNEPAQPLVR